MKKKRSGRPEIPEPESGPGLPPGLFAVLSHELKSPIHSIESLLKVVADGFSGELNPKALELVTSALAKTGEARALIADFLNLEKYSTGRLEKRAEELIAIVERVTRRFQSAAAERNTSITFRSPSDLRLGLLADGEALALAFGNLIDNAIKFSGANGRVAVGVAVDRDARAGLVTVSDSGPGIPDEDRARLFTPFFRSSRHRAVYPGTGLGLSIVKRVIEEHGGEISAVSTGAGTVFTVRLPGVSIEQAEASTKRRVVIVGGVTAGPKTAARLRRLDQACEITIVEKSEFLSYAGCGIPAYVAGQVVSPKALMSTADQTLRDVNFFEHIKDIRVLNRTLAEGIDRERRVLTVRDLVTGTASLLPYDALVLATGARSVVPPVPGMTDGRVHSLYNFEDAERLKRFFSQRPAAEVYIVGGGLIGVETAESLLSAGARVTILEKEQFILKPFDPDLARKITEILSLKGVKVITGVAIREIVHEDARSIVITDRGDFNADLIVLAAGVTPDTGLAARAGLALGPRGGVLVDEYLRTSDPAVFAAGDCAETSGPASRSVAARTWLPLGSVSTKMGRIAADNIAGRQTKFTGGIGTAMFKVFETSVARTGLLTAEAREEGFQPETVVVSGLDRAHYAKGAEAIVLKVIADRETKRLLGAQGFGRGDLVSRIELLAAAVGRSLTLPEVFALDLGYFPAFNNPIDILQTACAVLENKIDGLVRTIALSDFLAAPGEGTVVNVSPAADFAFQPIPGSVNLPLETLRLSPLPFGKSAPLVLCSKTSSRAYEAYRYLASEGYTNIRVLEGGYFHFKKG